MTMGAATFAIVVFGVLAAEIIAEFGIDRWQVGALVTATALTGAVVSPWLGKVADRIGARRATISTLLVSVLSLLAVAVAPTFLLLVFASILTGMAQAASNPATNKLISLHIPLGRQGLITGIKQSGVQFGTFFGGVMLPVFAAWWGWRIAVLIFALIPVSGILLSLVSVPPDPPEEGSVGGVARKLPAYIFRLALYGLLLGGGGTTIFTYLPLFGQEELGLSQSLTGVAVAVMGLAGVVARITWGRIAESHLGSVRALAWIAILAALAAAMLAVAPGVGSPLLWLAAVVTGVSASAWNAVGMLAIIQTLPPAQAGRGSGIVLLGFLAGLGLGAPVFGWSVDELGTYTPGWLAVAGLFILAWLAIRRVVAPSQPQALAA